MEYGVTQQFNISGRAQFLPKYLRENKKIGTHEVHMQARSTALSLTLIFEEVTAFGI